MDNIDDVEMNSFLNSRPIHIANLKQYVLHNHTNSDHGFFTEYEVRVSFPSLFHVKNVLLMLKDGVLNFAELLKHTK